MPQYDSHHKTNNGPDEYVYYVQTLILDWMAYYIYTGLGKQGRNKQIDMDW